MSVETRKWALKVNRAGDRGTITVGNVKLTVIFDECVDHETAFGEKSQYGIMWHNRYRVTATNTDERKSVSWKFHDSAANTQEKNLFPEDLGYSILCGVRSDFYYTEENYPTFEDFCSEFGYDTDSRRAERVYKACLSLAEKLHRVFSEELIETLPQ